MAKPSPDVQADPGKHEGMIRFLEMDGYARHRYSLVSSFFAGGSGRFLDVGCCRGELREHLGPSYEYSGVDGMECSFPGFHQVDLNGKALPFPDGSFDAISCCAVLEHLFYPLEMLREMKRVLKDSGALLVSLPNDRGLSTIAGAFMEPASYEEQIFGHHWRFSIASARAFFGKEFRIVKEKAEYGPLYRRYLPFLMLNPFCTEWFMLGRKLQVD